MNPREVGLRLDAYSAIQAVRPGDLLDVLGQPGSHAASVRRLGHGRAQLSPRSRRVLGLVTALSA
jgi:hypothetical protein